jgi:hypothetical protein
MWSEDSNQQTTLQAGGTSTVVLHFEAAKHWSWSSLLSFTPENTKVSAIVTFAPASDTTNGIDKDVAPVGIHLEPPLWLLLAGAVFGSAAATIGFLVYPRLAQLLGLPIPAFLQRPPVANWKKIATDSLIIFTAFSVLSCAIILLSVPFSQSSSWISFAILDVRGAVLVGLGGLALSRRLANYLNDTADLRPRPLDVPAPEVQPES